ncbi:MAG: prolipoprotein diacylglyceryl transferase [Clostridia bacterium]|nr:prolipoprotein diacylglyceryl transferase [Clostridia bacterium]
MSTYSVVIFGIHLRIRPVAFTLPIGKDGWDIYWYGIIIATGFLLAILYGAKNAGRLNINFDKLLDVVLITTPVAILCARTYYVIFDGEKSISGISEFFGFGTNSGFSGLAIYGGIIGAAVCGTLMCKFKKINVLDALDLASISFLIGQGIGRWGNFMNQEAYGSFTGSSFWGMQSERTVLEMGEGLVHPCFLYESVWCIAGFFVLHRLSKKRLFSGEVALYYCIWYGFGRAIIELLRTDSLMLGPIKISCALSLLICLSSVITLIVIKKKMANSVENYAYVEVFSSVENNDNQISMQKEDNNE